MPNKVLIEETISKPSRVDANAGILYDCLFLGVSSRNGTDYPTATRNDAIPLMEGAKVNLSHPSKRDHQALTESVSWDRRIGRAFGVHNADDGIRGNVQLLKKHAFTQTLIEAANEMPDMFGFSPVMVGTCTQPDANGRETCIKIKKLKSIDLVTDPGSTKSLFEDIDMEKLLTEEEEPKTEAAAAPEEEGGYEHLDPKAAHELALMHAVLAEVEDFLNEGGSHENAHARIGKHLKHHASIHHESKDENKEEEKPAEGEKKPEEKMQAKEEEKQEDTRWDLLFKRGDSVLVEEEAPVKVSKPQSPYVGASNGSQSEDWNKFVRTN